MNEELTDGRRVKSFVLPGPGVAIRCGDEYESGQIVSMMISMENGQMAAVPWIRIGIEDADGDPSVDMVNCALCLSVELEAADA